MVTYSNDAIYNKFNFLNDANFARHTLYPNQPCYRLIVCHKLYLVGKSNESNFSAVEEAISMLHKCYDNLVDDNNCIFYLESFLEIYKCKFINNEYGYILVDKTNGIFPLILYLYSNSSYNGILAKERANGLLASIDDISFRKKDKLMSAFKAHENWESLQAELKVIFKRKNSNLNSFKLTNTSQSHKRKA